MTSDPPRPAGEALRKWVSQHCQGLSELHALTGDVSPRRYYRAHFAGGSRIVAEYPPELCDAAERFCRTDMLLRSVGVPAPSILAFAPEDGWMLLDDAGDETLFDARQLPWATLLPRLSHAARLIDRIQLLDPTAVLELNPALDAELLWRELRTSWDLVLEPRALWPDRAARRRLSEALQRLCESLQTGGLVPCHRDYMARNLVPASPEPELIVLDHQDLRLGPRAYDAASLVNDSLFLTESAAVDVLGAEVVEGVDYRRAAAQRSLKISGTFVSFAQRGESRYLPFVDICLGRALDHLACLPETRELAQELAPTWRERLAPGPSATIGRRALRAGEPS